MPAARSAARGSPDWSSMSNGTSTAAVVLTSVPAPLTQPASTEGKMMMEKAKINGIMPALFTRRGMKLCPLWRYIRPPRNWLRAYWTGMRRCASWKSTISAIRTSATMTTTTMPTMPVSLWRTWLKRVGKLATIPPKMISESPFPTPFSVISSPSQIRNMVPAVREMTAESVGSKSSPVKPMPEMALAFSSRRSCP